MHAEARPLTTATDRVAGPGPAADVSGPVAAVADELEWTFRQRRGWLAGLAFNLAVAAAFVCYRHVDVHQHDRLRVAGIATGVAAWVLADPLNTDQLGSDARRTRDALGRGESIVRILALKNLMLAALLVPVAVVISIVTRLSIDHWRDIPHTVLLDVFVVFMWLGIGNIASVLVPYHPIRLAERWHLRRTWPRWAFCLALPYLIFYAGVSGWLHWPAWELCHRTFEPAHRHLMAWACTYAVWGVLVWGVGLAFASVYVRLTGDRLERTLARRE